MGNPVHLVLGKKGEILSCMGTDSRFYVFLKSKDEKIKYLQTCESFNEAKAIATQKGGQLNT